MEGLQDRGEQGSPTAESKAAPGDAPGLGQWHMVKQRQSQGPGQAPPPACSAHSLWTRNDSPIDMASRPEPLEQSLRGHHWEEALPWL